MRSMLTSLSIVAALVGSGAMLSIADAQDKGARTSSADRGKAVTKKKTDRAVKTGKSRLAAKTKTGRRTAAARTGRRTAATGSRRGFGFLPTTQGATKQPGSCGTYMYWKDGSCADARTKKK